MNENKRVINVYFTCGMRLRVENMVEEKESSEKKMEKGAEDTPGERIELEEELPKSRSSTLILETAVVRLVLVGIIGIIILFVMAVIGQLVFGVIGAAIGAALGIIILVLLLWASWRADKAGN